MNQSAARTMRRGLRRAGPWPRLWRKAIALATAAAAIAVMSGCKGREEEAPLTPPAVTVAQPVTERVADYIDFTGNTAAIDSVKLVARVEGYLEKIHFKDGD